ncbi:MAG: 16S rRNA (cytidine(1402)-2'-O)-methyltransferase [Verrucomicrobia bacterium]|jgi:16S rRNA (cytidine1402-2'-O)-methyltransferase|nr:MAG: 16S rRNA (cytidine(1402)-2'-O)-methyltransferase [Verrucomicrobiota bacterium]MDH4469905.1 16S rRNA (cytidine(1402)-2'-O)-methyltransferase [Verrucomicrobiae bacterium]
MLFILPTPIGNLGDLSHRVEAVLASCDLVLAEDTRRAEQLLSHLGVRKKIVSFQEHNEEQRLPFIMDVLHAGKEVALLTDAGTPSISDPGFRLVRACINEKISYTVLPGPSAVTTALVGSGLPPVPFYFGGFLPNSASKRRSEIKALLERGITSLYFESPHRLPACLKDFTTLLPEARLCVARELSKKFEEYVHGTPQEVLIHFSSKAVKGEITLVVHPYPVSAKKTEDYSEKIPILRNLA